MFSIRNKKRINRSYSPQTRRAVKEALDTKCLESPADRGYYRPRSSQTRCGKFTRAIGKPTTAPAGSRLAGGTKPRALSNTKKNQTLPVHNVVQLPSPHPTARCRLTVTGNLNRRSPQQRYLRLAVGCGHTPGLESSYDSNYLLYSCGKHSLHKVL